MIPTFDLKRRKGQGAFEYILLVAGILLIVVIVVFLLKGGLQSQAGSSGAVTQSTQKININVETACLDFCGDGAWAAYNSSTSLDTNCTLTKGINGDSFCFYPGNSTGGPCDSSLHAGNTALHPQNTAFCTYVRQSKVGG